MVLHSTQALQHVKDTCITPRDYGRQYHVMPAQWDALTGTIQDVRFGERPKRIVARDAAGLLEIQSNDDDLCISVVRGRVRRTVCGQAHPLSITTDGSRFLKVWAALTAIVPEPK